MITEKEVQHIARLSRIYLKPQEVKNLQKEMEAILGYVQKLEKLNVSQIQPTSHVLPLKNIFRPDEIKPSLSQADALKFSVQQEKGSFKVPKVIE